MFKKLNLPSFEIQLKKNRNGYSIRDIIRNKYVVLTPEEWVRQHFINYLITQKKYPKGLISVEINTGNLEVKNRADIIIYDKYGKEWMLIECKASEINLSQDALYQALRYYINITTKYIVLTNGITHFCLKMDENQYYFLDELPDFQD